MGLKDSLGGINITRRKILREPISSLGLVISTSRIVEVDEKSGQVVDEISSDNGESHAKPATLERGLKSRHAQLIAIGGAVGTGLFVGSGAVLVTCGPASLFLS